MADDKKQRMIRSGLYVVWRWSVPGDVDAINGKTFPEATRLYLIPIAERRVGFAKPWAGDFRCAVMFEKRTTAFTHAAAQEMPCGVAELVSRQNAGELEALDDEQ